MAKKYSQTRALLAIAKASFTSIFRSPSATFFSLFFPIVLIVIFGSLGGGGGVSFDIAFDKNSDTTNPVYQAITNAHMFDVFRGSDTDVADRLKKGRITAVLTIKKTDSAKYDVHIKSTTASVREMPGLKESLQGLINEISQRTHPVEKMVSTSEEVVSIRPYKRIDFYLPGMIGFSLIGSAVFGVSFLFFSLRETLVLKRMYASPVTKSNIVIGESIGRILFQLLIVIVLILFGKYAYDFTLVHGFVTFIELLVLSTLALIVFMGFGFFISSIAKNQNVIPIFANLFMFPQYFLSGTFFPKTALPKSINWLIEALPLTALNDALRKVAFEGSHLGDCWKQIGILGIWGVVIYAATIKVFRWE
ncbi:MAG TPA: ABC transporter permease [Chitinophagaceae bacterium]|nr:ABC transporter permease [Chitinophagaceae bacterium]